MDNQEDGEYFLILGNSYSLNKEFCVLCLFQLGIGITHIVKGAFTCQFNNHTWTRTKSRVMGFG